MGFDIGIEVVIGS